MTPGCPVLVHGGYCPACRQRRIQTGNRHHSPDRRLAKSFYLQPRWRSLRKLFLSTHPACPCGAIATEPDHIEDRRAVEDPFDQVNLQALCKSCHSRKTMRALRATRPEFAQRP